MKPELLTKRPERKKKIELYLSGEEHADLLSRSISADMSMNAYIRKALKEGLKHV